MGLLNRLFNRSLPASTTQCEVRTQPGPLTVHEAWAYVKPEALALDPKAQLVLITSGTDLQADGRSFTWEFLFHLPDRGAGFMATVMPSDSAPEVDSAPLVMVKRVTPSSAPVKGGGLPLDFRDSPEVVAELVRGGVDFVAGPTDMKLEARLLSSGRPAWVTYYWDEERPVAFTAQAD